MSAARWHCHLCRAWGTNGPHGAVEHLRRTHTQPGWGVGASTERAHLPNYADDSNRSTRWAVRPVIAFGFGPTP